MKNVKIYLFEGSDLVATNTTKEKTINWYKNEYGYDGDEDLLIKERELSDKMWFTGHIEEDYELELLEELSYTDTNQQKDNYLILNGLVYEKLTFEEVLGYLECEHNIDKIFIIGSYRMVD